MNDRTKDALGWLFLWMVYPFLWVADKTERAKHFAATVKRAMRHDFR